MNDKTHYAVSNGKTYYGVFKADQIVYMFDTFVNAHASYLRMKKKGWVDSLQRLTVDHDGIVFGTSWDEEAQSWND